MSGSLFAEKILKSLFLSEFVKILVSVVVDLFLTKFDHWLTMNIINKFMN